MINTGRCRGFSLLELVAVIAIVGILLAVAIHRLLPYIDEAERIGVLTLESQIQSTLMTAAAKRIAGGNAASIVDLNGINPMQMMLEAPDNYAGELTGDDSSAVPRRNWYFNLNTRRLVYRKGQAFGQSEEIASMADPEFEVRIAFDDSNGNGRFEPGTDELFGVRLHRTAGAQWLAERHSATQ